MNTPDAAISLSPLFPAARRLNARFVEREGWRISEVFTNAESEVAVARTGVVLADETPNGKLRVQGEEAEAILQTVFERVPQTVGEGVVRADVRIYRLRKDLFFLSTPPGKKDAVQVGVTDQLSDAFATVTDVTHGLAEIRMVGPASPDLLSKLCGLDFHPRAFPNGAARQTSLAKTAQLILRRDIGSIPAFSLIGGQSLGIYMWDTIVEAGQEWGLIPIGWAGLDLLDTDSKDV